jgi:hypothetical protein
MAQEVFLDHRTELKMSGQLQDNAAVEPLWNKRYYPGGNRFNSSSDSSFGEMVKGKKSISNAEKYLFSIGLCGC